MYKSHHCGVCLVSVGFDIHVFIASPFVRGLIQRKESFVRNIFTAELAIIFIHYNLGNHYVDWL